MNNSLIEQKIIENLIIGREQIIELYCEAIVQQQKILSTIELINNQIPRNNSSFGDSFSEILYTIPKRLGMDVHTLVIPSTAYSLSKSPDDIKDIITKSVDGTIWKMLFNRLGMYGYMSSSQQLKFHSSCDDSPTPFTLDNVAATLTSLYTNHDKILLESLLDTFTNLSNSYVSNDKCKFNKKLIMEDVFCEYGGTYRLSSSELESLLGVIWRWVLRNKLVVTENGIDVNEIWNELKTSLTESQGNIKNIKHVYVAGIEFRFFLKKTVHIIFPESMISQLNDQLAKTNALAKF